MKVGRLWGGRFEELPPKEIVEFLSGRDVHGRPPCDQRLIPYDLWGNRAHVLMLFQQELISKQDGMKIVRGLREIETLHRKGKFRLNASKEDVHSNIESCLIDRIGIESGGKIHTGRSRNDQIVLDMRLYLRDEVLEFVAGLVLLMETLIQKADEHRSTIMPGYTHHQHAVATTFGHLLLSFAEAFQRDVQRFSHWFELFNQNPLGAAAGYGTTFRLDRSLTAKLLAFNGPSGNVTDPITQRWEPEAELAYDIAVMMDHLSTMAQSLIVLSTREFNMIRLSDRHCTGSSIMPQKRNPCSLEVIKAKTSFAHGMVLSLLSMGKALFMGYNRDTQWTKYWIMDLLDESKPAVSVMADVIGLMQVNIKQMLMLAREGFLGATPLMEWLVSYGKLPMRKAKMVMEKAVKYSESEGSERISYESLKKALDEMEITVSVKEEVVNGIQNPERIRNTTLSSGTSSKNRGREGMALFRKKIQKNRNWLINKRKEIERAKALMFNMEKELFKNTKFQPPNSK